MALRDRLESSPLIGWLKDLDGRYVYVNRSYLEQLGASADRVLGHVDAELPPREAIDGPRLQDGASLEDEPIQFEYRVAASDGRPELAVLRFPVCDEDGSPICICGVAAPVEQADLARAECAKLMELGTSNGSGGSAGSGGSGGAGDVGADDLELERRRVAGLHEASASAARRAHELAVELSTVREQRQQLQSQLGLERDRRTRVEQELADFRASVSETDADPARVEELSAALERERSRARELMSAAQELQARVAAAEEGEGRQRARAEQAEEALRGARARSEAAQAEADRTQSLVESLRMDLAHATARRDQLESEQRAMAEALDHARLQAARRPEPVSCVDEDVPSWTGRAQRALAVAMAHSSEWRAGIRDAVKVIGAQGGWDAATVWSADERHPHQLRCLAMWLRDADRHVAFETQTWQQPHAMSGTELGHAFRAGEAAWLTGLLESDDNRLMTAAAEGMTTALIVPVCDGSSSIAVLELLTGHTVSPDEDLAAALTAVALQLGHFWHLLQIGAAPRWRVGRM